MANIQQNLQTAHTHTLAMTKGLQQSIHLLQLSNLELYKEITEIALENPFIEVEATENISFENLAKEVSLNSPLSEKAYYKNLAFNENINIQNLTSQPESLYSFLTWQLNASNIPNEYQKIAEVVIDNIDESGYLFIPINEIFETIKQSNKNISLDDVLYVLKLIQNFEPLGVGARCVQECLLIQLEQNNSFEANLAKDIIKNDLNFLKNKEFNKIIKKYKVSNTFLKKALNVIKNLNPKPGCNFSTNSSNFIRPDLLLISIDNVNCDIVINEDTLPKIYINKNNYFFEKEIINPIDLNYLKRNIQEAKILIKNINYRNATLIKVSKAIIIHQKEFLQKGINFIKPLTLKEIALETGLHEATISRATAEKYISTPQGIFELKFFFSSKITNNNDELTSSIVIKNLIKDLIVNEDKRKPLSDNLITQKLNEKGLNLARRTVAKYREELGFAASSLRKNLI